LEAPDTTLIDIDDTQKQMWRSHAIAAIAFSLLLLIIFYETTWSMVHIWYRSETFAHGFLIFPISIWLIWGRRDILQNIPPSAEYRALVAMAMAGALWLAGNLVDALVVQQFALIGLLAGGIWSILGSQVTMAISFPLAYLFFAVPVGEDLVPPLMEFTATFTIELVKLSGIPVFREGLYFSLPTGNWSVVEACSGIRYLIASVTLGSLYAYLTYHSLLKRSVFILFSILVPIIANGLRAYMIVMLGHLSDMTIATGVDHLIYGWLFFGLVMMLLFWVGAKWRDLEPDVELPAKLASRHEFYRTNRANPLVAAGIVLVMAGLWPGLAQLLESQVPAVPTAELAAPEGVDGWISTQQDRWAWRPMMLGADKRMDQLYQKNGWHAQLSVGQYIAQRQDQEMVNSQNLLVDPELSSWRVTGSRKQSAKLQAGNIDLDETNMSGENKQLLTWSWYRIGENYTSNPYIAKIYEALAKLSFSQRGGAKIVVAIEFDDSSVDAEIELERFAHSILPALEIALDRVTDSNQ